jgi:hypothetical protein
MDWKLKLNGKRQALHKFFDGKWLLEKLKWK